VTEYFLRCSGPVNKIKKWGFYSPYSVLPNINAPGPDVQFLKNAGAWKPGKGLSIHSQWPSIFYKALGQSIKLKNKDSTVHAVFYLIVMHWVWMSNFWRTPEPENPVKACRYIHGDRVFFTTLWASQKKKKKKLRILRPCSVLSDSNAPGLDVQFLKNTRAQNLVKACWYIHSDQSFFIRLWTSQKN